MDLQSVLGLTTLTALTHLNYYCVPDTHPPEIWSKLTKLAHLTLTQTQVTDQLLSLFPSSLQSLQCKWTYKYSNNGLIALAKNCPKLQSLSIGSRTHSNGIHFADKVTGEGLLAFKNLIRLEIPYLDNVPNEALEQLALLNPKLEYFSLSRDEGKLPDDVILKIVTWNTLKYISLDHSEITTDGFVTILKRNPYLENVRLFGCCKLNGVIYPEKADFVHKKMKELSLYSGSMTDFALQVIVNICRGLESLIITSAKQLTVEYPRSLMTLKQLKTLDARFVKGARGVEK